MDSTEWLIMKTVSTSVTSPTDTEGFQFNENDRQANNTATPGKAALPYKINRGHTITNHSSVDNSPPSFIDPSPPVAVDDGRNEFGCSNQTGSKGVYHNQDSLSISTLLMDSPHNHPVSAYSTKTNVNHLEDILFWPPVMEYCVVPGDPTFPNTYTYSAPTS